MKSSLLVLLMFSLAAAYAQPLDGPWQIMITNDTVDQVYAVTRNDSIADVFYRLGGGLNHLSIRLTDGELHAQPEALPATPNYMHSLQGALMTNDGWVVLLQEESPATGLNRIVTGWDQWEATRVIDSIRHLESQFFPFGGNRNAGLFADPGGGFWTAWTADRVFWTGFFWEGYTWPDLRRFAGFYADPDIGVPCVCWNWTCISDWVFVTPVTPDSATILFGDNYQAGLSAACAEPEYGGWGHAMLTPTAPLAAMKTHGPRYLLLSAQGTNYFGPFPARIIEFDTAGQFAEVLAIPDNPLAAAAHPDFGMAWLSKPAEGLILTRADTLGAIVHPAGVVQWPADGTRIGTGNVAIEEDGSVLVIWTTVETADPHLTRIWIAALNWTSPLSSGPSDFTLPPSSFSLSSYPNPFNSTTQVRFELPRAARSTLDVFDITGRHVRQLLNRSLPAGTHAVSFEAGDLPSGIYLAALRAGGQTATARIVLLR